MGDDDIVFKHYRDESRKNYGQHTKKKDGLCIDQIRLGCDLRSADALEQIAESLRETRWMSNREREEMYNSRGKIAELKLLIKKQKVEITRLKQ